MPQGWPGQLTVSTLQIRMGFCHPAGKSPWSIEPRVVASMDFVKRRDRAFRELAGSRWDVVFVDEAHHFVSSRDAEDLTDRHRLGRQP